MKSQDRLKVLFLTAWYPHSENPASGVFVRESAKAVALHHDVVVLFRGGVGECDRGFYQFSDQIEDGLRPIRVTIRRSPIPKTTFMLHLWAVFQAFRQLMKSGFRPDVIHAHVYSAGLPAVLLGGLYSIPVVITEHFSGFPRKVMARSAVQEARFAMERARLVLPVSQNLAQHIAAYGIKAKFRVVPNAVDTKTFSPPSRVAGAASVKRLLLVCLLDPIKGIPLLLQAVADLGKARRDFRLDIVGDGPNREEYFRLASELGLDGLVRFHGLRPKPEVAEFMRRSDIFVLPSLQETFGVVFAEAMASGLPIVATRAGGIPEVVSENAGLLVPPGDVKALTNALDWMLDHYLEYDRERIAQEARGRYSYEAVAGTLDEIYRSQLTR